MGRTGPIALALVIGTLGCQGGGAEPGGPGAGGSGASASGAGGSAAGSATGSVDRARVGQRPTTPPARVVEIVTPTFYRAVDGTAAFTYPTLDGQWRATLDRSSPVLPQIRLDYTGASGGARIQVMFPARATAPVDAQAVATAAASQLAQAVGGTTEAGRTFGPGTYGVRVRAPAGAVPVVSTVLALVDGRDVALVVSTGGAAALGEPAFLAAYQATLGHVQVGAQIPAPPPADPGTPLEGAYVQVGRDQGEFAVLVFDRRGYVHARADQAVDIDALWAMARADVARYTFDGTRLTIDGAGRHVTGTVDRDGLQLAGEARAYRPSALPATLDGTFAASIAPVVNRGAYDTFSAFQAARYVFSAAGTFRTSSSSSIEAGPTAAGTGPTVRADAGDRTSGRYQLDGDRLILRFADGTSAIEPIYGRASSAGITMLFIGGQMYLREP
jgi:hypothetical protein